MGEMITQDGEIIETENVSREQMSLAIGLTRAEIDQQIATAHAYPRSITKATKNILSLVTIDAQSAEECNYSLPRGGKAISGPSIRLAEIVAGQWGNCRVGARVVHVDRAEKYVEAEGVFHDLETNTATTARVRRRISDKNNKLLTEDMIIVTGNAAASIAKRNAILGGVPKAVWRKAHDAALSTIKGDVKTLRERRDTIMKAFAAFGVKPEQVTAAIDLGGIDDVMIEHMPILVGMASALKSGEATVEEMFGAGAKSVASGGEKKGLAGKLQDVADAGDQAKDQDKKSDTGGNKKKDEAKSETKSEEKKEGSADKKKEADKKSSGPEDGDGFPGDTPTVSSDEITAADDRGFEDFHNGRSRKAIPAEFRNVAPLSEAWLGGYDRAEKAEDNQAENQ